ncbi:MAG TPA: BlaI/MecI/CopY family transcriptional regulator [Aggregatilineales bacterium]|nr:BlaI/MecI/CopY family transcriptional regulator [Aggregatilineales bacterium]
MGAELYHQLSKRERQIMDIVFELGEATATEIVERLPEPSSNSSIRILLGILEEKGHLNHRTEGARFVYRPTLEVDRARRSALAYLTRTFFGGSASQVVQALLDNPDLSDAERAELLRLIDQARKEGR